MRDGFLDNAIYHLVLILESVQLLLPFVFRLLILLHSISPTSHRSSHPIHDGTFGAHSSAILGTMRGVLAFRNSCVLEKHTKTLYTMVPVVSPFRDFLERKYTSHSAENCTGFRTKRPINYWVGGPMGSRTNAVQQYKKSENKL